MKILCLLASVSLIFLSSNSYAEDDLFDVLGESSGSTIGANISSSADTESSKTLSSFLSSKIPSSTARNIEKAEKIFCYTVANVDLSKEDEYRLNDNIAVTGSCGEISEAGKTLFKETLWNNASAFSNNLDSCNISPTIALRYVYGPDHTDVLLSYPCPAVTFFHGRDIITVNAAPAEKIIEQISNTYSGLSEKYLSPALMKQMVANGQVMTEDQKEMVRKINSSDISVKKWNKDTPETNTDDNSLATEDPARPRKGWNKLK